VARLNDKALRFLRDDWVWTVARPEQLAPQGDWRIWLFLGGRGAGKTRSGAEWIKEGVDAGTMHRVGLIGATHQDVRAVMLEGVSGLLGALPSAKYEPANQRVLFANGAVATVLSADRPDAIRGHQFDAIWGDGDRAPRKVVPRA
jgi:phage terminase large subunit-like protein